MFIRSFRCTLFAVLALVSGIVAQGAQPSSAEAHDGHGQSSADSSSGPPVAPANGADLASVSPRWWEGDDVLLSGRSHSDGYTLYVALEKEKYVLRPLATIRPAGYAGDDWLGYTCLTGDRRFAVATLMPRWAVNVPRLRDRGALAYVVSTANGKIWPLANEVAFKYHATNCGVGSKVALMRNLGDDQRQSEVLVADAATRRVTSLGVVRQQLTSPVPDGTAAVALGLGGILAVQPGGNTVLRTKIVGGIPYRMVARGTGQTVAVLRGENVDAYAVEGSRLLLAGSGAKDDAQIYASEGSIPRLSGLQAPPKRAIATSPVARPKLTANDGAGVVGRDLAIDAVSAEGKVVLATTTAGMISQRTVVPGEPESETTQAAPAPEEKRLFSALTGALLVGRFPVESAASVSEVVPTTVTKAGRFAPAGNFTTPKCGVPRNEPTRMAYGANDVQARWAVEQASRNSLPTRPTDYLKSGLPSYNPSSDFRLQTIKPSGGNVPPAVFNGVLAQESAYRQASRRTLPGSGGNSVIGNYYGAGGTLDVIDYTKADCGYGISQVTSGMATSETSITPNGKAKIAIDYAENIQAGMNILVKKWNQLQDAGIKLNNSDPAAVENWYLALWAYNSGVQPDARFGNTTGCTPSPTCTDEFGNWGLGWSNNPRNPDYPPTRNVFLRATYADAEHPSDWPYQERIIGWAETPIKNYKGEDAYEAAAPGTNYPYPNINTFCTAANSCDPATVTGCTRADYRCWWHEPVSFKSCSPLNLCTTSNFTTTVGAPEPSAPNPWEPACDSELGPDAIIVDDIPDPSKNIFCPNRNWTNQGTFTYEVGKDASGAPLGVIDFHQAAVGFGAHTFFTGNRVASDTAHKVTGTWKPANLQGSYLVRAHIPRAGASVSSAVYKITTADGNVSEKVVNQHEHFNHWKTLGAFQLDSNAQVQLTNVTQDDVIGGAGTVAFDAVAFIPVLGVAVNEDIDAYAYFDPDTDVTTSGTTSWLAGPLGGPQALYDWGAARAPGLVQDGGPATRLMGTVWRDENLAAYTSPDADDDGMSPAVLLGEANKLEYRPTIAQKPPEFDTDADAYKVRTTVRVSYVSTGVNQIMEGSADVDYRQRAGNTYIPRLITDFFDAVTQDYGIAKPDLSYSTTNLNTYDHQIRSVTPNTTFFPARAFKPAGRAPLLVNESGQPGTDCIFAIHTFGGVDGFRPMLGVGYVSSRVEAWKERINDRTDIPAAVKNVAKDIYDVWFDTGAFNGAPPASVFNQAPPIWQELAFTICANGKLIAPQSQGHVLRASWMTDQYLYRNGAAVENTGEWRFSPDPLMRGDFVKFSRIPDPDNFWDNPFGECDTNTGRSGNPWGLFAGLNAPGVDPASVHFCIDKDLGVDPDAGG
ncbi:golvesin C-terminal-like domain-containing protein [Kribbella pratensis]|uniref:golvesin C-terminal-like domain-containing protein n=1 Tax=Kribbella pratensis TaxID=2512112 RepID=UPI0010660D76|nr:hypothetical protein [Kribbella pratensis]